MNGELEQLLYPPYVECEASATMIWTLVWIVLGVIVLVILLRVLFGVI